MLFLFCVEIVNNRLSSIDGVDATVGSSLNLLS